MKANNYKFEVSVVIPVYKTENYITDALASVLQQNVTFEILLVDDLSPDNSIKRAVSFLNSINFTNYRVITSGINQGPGGARNLGVKNAKYDLIAFLDADDIWEKGKLAEQISLLNSCEASLCCTGRDLIDSNGVPLDVYVGVNDTVSYSDILRTNSISLSSVLIPKSIAIEHPFPTARDVHEDYICWLNILKEHGNAAGIDRPLLLYRKSDNQKTGSKLKSAIMHYRSLRAAGIGAVKSIIFFVSYTINGIKKHRGLK